MAIWLEMRCEGRALEGREACWSNANDGPMLLVGDTLADVRQGYAELREQAARLKWKQTRKGWYCPSCITAGLAGGRGEPPMGDAGDGQGEQR